MASINSLPLELIDLIIRRAATSVDEYDFENQLALTARISSNWTTFSEQLLQSHIILADQEKAEAYLESGSAGKHKTRVLQLRGDIESDTVKKVTEKTKGLETLVIDSEEGVFDMNILQDDRFSGLASIVISSDLEFDSISSIPFPFTLRNLHLLSGSTCSPSLLDALLLNSRSTITSLAVECNQDFLEDTNSVLHLEEFTALTHLRARLGDIGSLLSLTKLVSIRTSCESWEEANIEKLEFILSTLPPSQLMDFNLGWFGRVEEITDEDLERIEKLLEHPKLNRLKTLEIGYEGVVLDKMQELVAEWKKIGIEAVFECLDSESGEDLEN